MAARRSSPPTDPHLIEGKPRLKPTPVREGFKVSLGLLGELHFVHPLSLAIFGGIMFYVAIYLAVQAVNWLWLS